MTEGGVGRLLVASLHQAIADLLPARLEFYEAWLNPVGLREGRIGLAPLAAVLSFLRQEGDAYRWCHSSAPESMPPNGPSPTWPRFRRSVIRHAPMRLRRAARHARGA